jgi:hypothetical protein
MLEFRPVPHHGARGGGSMRLGMRLAPRTAARAAAVAFAAAGTLLLMGVEPLGGAAQTQPPPSTASTAVEVAPTAAQPGTSITVNGQGFVPAVGYTLTLCAAPACPPGAPAQKCQLAAADNTGNVLCNFDIPQEFPPGDAVVTVRQDIAAGSPAATACPSPLTSPVATIPAVPAAPASLPAAPVPLPSSGNTLVPCVREASAILTVLPLPGGDSTLEPEPVVVLPPLSTDTGGGTITVPQAPAAPQPRATARPRPKAAPRPVIRAVAAGLPARSLIPGVLLTVIGIVVFTGSLVPGPPAPGPVAPAGGTRLSRFVSSMPRRASGAGAATSVNIDSGAGAAAGGGRLRAFVRGQAGIGGRMLRALRSLRR